MLLNLLVSLTIIGVFVQATCTSPKIRREWSQLSATEKGQYISAMKALNARPQSNQYQDASRISWNDLTLTHARNAWWAHANAEFLVYHRAMLFRFEQALQSVGWNGGVVYLDEAAYSSNWQNLDIFSDQYYGGEGSAAQCLAGGQFSKANGFNVLAADGSSSQCLQRCGGSGSFWSTQQITNILSSATKYENIRYDDTINFHAAGHAVLGGKCDMGDPSWSPRDPVFYLHHAYIDKIYWKWQNLCSSYKTDYEGNLASGSDPTSPLLGNSAPVDPSQPLDSWAGLTAQDMFDTNSDLLCYTYSRSDGDVDYSHPQCPDGSAPNYNPYGGAKVVPPPPPPPTNPPITSSQPTNSPATNPPLTDPPTNPPTHKPKTNPSATSFQTTSPVSSIINLIAVTSVPSLNNLITPNSVNSGNNSISVDDLWLFELIRGLVSKGSSSLKQKKAVLNKRNIQTLSGQKKHTGSFVIDKGPNDTTLVNVTTTNAQYNYVIPAGCTLWKVFFSHISILPANYTYNHSQGLPANNSCPVLLHPQCDQPPTCARYPGFQPPTPSSPCQYAATLTDSEILKWNLNPCNIRKSDCKMYWQVDECNAKTAAKQF